MFDNVRYDSNKSAPSTRSTRVEGFWNTGTDEGPNLGYKIRPKSGYFPVPPHDTLMDIRSEMVLDHGMSSAFRSRSTITRSAPPVSARSTCASIR